MNRASALLILVSASLLSILTGCPPANSTRELPGYIGDTDPIEKVVADINSNNSKIPTLWAHQKFDAWFVDDEKHTNFLNGSGTLLYSGPGSVRLTAKKDIQDLFAMGCNADQFWLQMSAQDNETYWGNMRNAGKPCMRQIPIRPDLVMQVLGVSQIAIDLTKQPVPVMRFNNNENAYMFVWQVQAGDHWNPQKEIWFDRVTKLPKAVMIFGDKGRVALAALSVYRPISVDNVDRKDWPQMATHYELFFPDTGSKMNFDLNDVSLSSKGFPKPKNFELPDMAQLRGQGIKVIQIDEDCGP